MQIKPKMNPKNSTKIKQIQPWQPVQGNMAVTVSESRTPWTKPTTAKSLQHTRLTVL